MKHLGLFAGMVGAFALLGAVAKNSKDQKGDNEPGDGDPDYLFRFRVLAAPKTDAEAVEIMKHAQAELEGVLVEQRNIGGGQVEFIIDGDRMINVDPRYIFNTPHAGFGWRLIEQSRA